MPITNNTYFLTTMSPSRAEDLAELGLADDDSVDERVIRKKYLRLSRSRHPDKGGTKESFQRLVNAYESYERLRSGAYAADASTEEQEYQEDDSYEYEEDYWYGEHYNFFGRAWEYGFEDESDYEDYFENWHREKAKARAKQRREELKRGYDYRDRKASPEDEKCMFCGVNQPITEEQAEAHDLNWEEYSAHPEGYKTCWVCKDQHVSVMTKKMACMKFAKKLDFTTRSSRTGGEYHPVFWFLKLDGRSFHHQPVTEYCEGPTLNSEYYWYPDLEMEALSLGWKPRGEKKNEVPWVRKDLSDNRSVVQAPSTPKKHKAKGPTKKSKVVTPEKRTKKRKR